MFDADLTGNFVARVDGTVTDCNPAFARMLGYDDEPDVLGRGATAIFAGESSWMVIAGGVARERRVRQHEIALRRSDGGAVHVLVAPPACSPIAGSWRPFAANCTTSRSTSSSRSSCGSRRRWKRSAGWPAASRTTSTTC